MKISTQLTNVGLAHTRPIKMAAIQIPRNMQQYSQQSVDCCHDPAYQSRGTN